MKRVGDWQSQIHQHRYCNQNCYSVSGIVDGNSDFERYRLQRYYLDASMDDLEV